MKRMPGYNRSEFKIDRIASGWIGLGGLGHLKLSGVMPGRSAPSRYAIL
jgi:hypothetical protein